VTTLANGAVRQKEVVNSDGGHRAIVVRQSDSDSGRSSLASNDNHSIGSDMSPTLNTSAGRMFVSQRHPLSPRVTSQPLASSGKYNFWLSRNCILNAFQLLLMKSFILTRPS